MRTTLKRRIGRWEQAGGNGRAASAPLIAHDRISVYQQPSPRGRVLRGVGHFLLNLAFVASVVAGGTAGGLYLWTTEGISQTTLTGPHGKASTQYLHVAVPNQPVTALVVGYDKRRGLAGDVGRSDTLMLVRLDPRKGKKSISLLSFPRDLRVPLYCKPDYSYGTGKINSAYSACGLEGSVLTVRALTGLPINYDVALNFRGFKDIVNKMSGVWINVDRRYYVPTGAGYASINLQPGYQRLRGGPALDYARYRHGDSDLFRIIRQQAFIRSFRQQFSKLSFTDYPSIINTVVDNISVGKKNGGSISARTLLGYAQLARRLSGGSIIQAKLENVANATDGSSDLIASQATIQDAVDSFSSPDLTAADRAAAQSNVGRAKAHAAVAPEPENTTVLVLNGGDTEGLARDTSYGLTQRSYKVVYPAGGAAANYPSATPLWHTIVFYDPGQAKSEAAAKQLATLFDVASVQKITPKIANLANGAMVVAALGQTFDGTLPAITKRVEVPTPSAPRVTTNPGLTSATLRGIQPRFPFRLELPSKLASSSNLVSTSESPVRVYRIAPKQTALRLTFQLAGNLSGYWSIEETTYMDAPVLSETHYTRVIGGRTFDTYLDGVHIQMIVLRENDASYWVINTLDNTLSNETMKAIAVGLRPAGGHLHG